MKKLLTADDVGLMPGCKLSSKFLNTHDCFKHVRESVIAHEILEHRGEYRVAPIYGATIYVPYHGVEMPSTLESYEVGEGYALASIEEIALAKTAHIALQALAARALIKRPK